MIVRPVLDILHGVVVHGRGGHRENYQPVVSPLTDRSDPISVAEALYDAFGLKSFYLADLDGILSGQPNFRLYGELAQKGYSLIIDAGVRGALEAGNVMDAGPGIRPIAGLETCESPQDLERILARCPDVIFSLDLVEGRPKRNSTDGGWREDPRAIVQQLQDLQVMNLLVLDLADVGMGTGGSTDPLCQFIHTEYPEMRLIAGGGVRGPADLKRLQTCGVDEVLVATALHDGRLTRSDIDLL